MKDGLVRFYDPATGRYLPTLGESRAEAAEECAGRETAEARAEAAEAEAAQERAGREAALARIEALEAELRAKR